MLSILFSIAGSCCITQRRMDGRRFEATFEDGLRLTGLIDDFGFHSPMLLKEFPERKRRQAHVDDASHQSAQSLIKNRVGRRTRKNDAHI